MHLRPSLTGGGSHNVPLRLSSPVGFLTDASPASSIYCWCAHKCTTCVHCLNDEEGFYQTHYTPHLIIRTLSLSLSYRIKYKISIDLFVYFMHVLLRNSFEKGLSTESLGAEISSGRKLHSTISLLNEWELGIGQKKYISRRSSRELAFIWRTIWSSSVNGPRLAILAWKENFSLNVARR